MPFYLLKTVIKQYKADEFIDSICSISAEINKENGCLSYKVYRDIKEENSYCVVGEWKTHQAMEKHFKTKKFELLVGAVRVLGESIEIITADFLETGNLKLAQHF